MQIDRVLLRRPCGASALALGTALLGAALALLSGVGVGAAEEDDPLAGERDADSRGKLLLIRVDGAIHSGLTASVRNEVERFLADEPGIEFVVFRIDSPGGELGASKELADFVFGLKGVRTIAWVPPDRFALSGGTMVALAAQDLVMGTNSHIGASTPVRPTSPNQLEELSEKEQSVVRSMLSSYASERKYPTILTNAMVSKDHPDILAVDFAESGIGTPQEKLKTRFLTQSDYENLPRRERTLQRGDRRIILRSGEVLTIDTKRAKEYGFAKAVADDIDELQLALKIEAEVVDGSSGPLKATSPTAQALVNFFNQPFARFVLIALGLLGFFLEFQLFGAMLPGIFGLLCFAVFFAAGLFPVSGSLVPSATVWEALVFLLGLVLIAVEFFLPGVAIFALSGAALCITSLVLAMLAPEGHEGQMTLRDAITVLIFGFGVGGLAFFFLLRALPRSRLLARRGIVSHATIEGVPTASSPLEAEARDSRLVGQEGKALTALRPAGKVELDDGTLVDVVTGGDFVARDDRVRVIEVGGGRTVVVPASRAEGSDPQPS